MRNYIHQILRGHSIFSNATYLLFIFFYFIDKHMFYTINKYFKTKPSTIYTIIKIITYVTNILIIKYKIPLICICMLLIILCINHYYYLIEHPLENINNLATNIYSGITYSNSTQSIFLNIVDFTTFIIFNFFKLWIILNILLNSLNLSQLLGFNICNFLLFIFNIFLSIKFLWYKLRLHISNHNSIDISYIIYNYFIIIRRYIFSNHKRLLLIKPNTIHLLKPFPIFTSSRYKNYFVITSCDSISKNNIKNLRSKIQKININIFNIKESIRADELNELLILKNLIKHLLLNKTEYIGLFNTHNRIKHSKRCLSTDVNNINNIANKYNFTILCKSQSFDACDSFFNNYIN